MNSKIWLNHSTYFSRREYLLVDTSYPLTRITMVPYRKPAANDPVNKRFNSRLPSIRVQAEYTIGQLKG
jgi:hypothetical protein